MIEVTIWFSNADGDGCQRYLINEPTDSQRGAAFFRSNASRRAIQCALLEFCEKQDYRVTRIDLRDTPDEILQP